jgi:hypothetical protein
MSDDEKDDAATADPSAAMSGTVFINDPPAPDTAGDAPAFGPPPSPEPPALVGSRRTETTNEAPALPPAPLPPPPDETRTPESRPEAKKAPTTPAANLDVGKPQAVNRVGPRPPSAVKRWALPILLMAGAAAFGGYLLATRGRRAPATPPTSQAATTTAKSAANTAPANTAANTAAPAPAPVDGPPPLAATVATSSASVAPPAPATAPAPAADLAACVAEVLPLGPMLESESLAFLCTDADARDAARSMTVALAASSDVPLDSKRRWAGMGWFQMATAQLLRSRCCGDVATMSGPPNLESCGTGPALGEIHRAVAVSSSLADAAKTYFTAVDCLFKTNTAKLFGQRRRPNAAELTSFVELSGGV